MEKCKATLVFGDDFGDNCCTFHCQLEAGHDGLHKETGDVGYGVIPVPYTLTWEGSDRELDKAMQNRAKKQPTQEH